MSNFVITVFSTKFYEIMTIPVYYLYSNNIILILAMFVLNKQLLLNTYFNKKKKFSVPKEISLLYTGYE